MPEHLRIAHLHRDAVTPLPRRLSPCLPSLCRAAPGLGLAALGWPLLCHSAYVGSNSAGLFLQKQTSACMCGAGRSSVSSSRGLV